MKSKMKKPTYQIKLSTKYAPIGSNKERFGTSILPQHPILEVYGNGPLANYVMLYKVTYFPKLNAFK